MKRNVKTVIITAIVLVVLVIGILSAEMLGGVWRTLSYNWVDHTDTEVRVKQYADKHGLSFGDYPKSLIELLKRNPETEVFVLEYPLWENSDWDLSEYENCESVPLFMQWDQRWGYKKYGRDFLAITGCGPTCLAMAGYYLTEDERFNPADVAEFAEKNGYYSQGNGSSWTLISEGGEKLGLDVTEIPLVKKRIVDNLAVGNPIICAMGPGDFTTSGHYIVITGMEDGLFQINDPNSYANSERRWSYEEIESQIRNLWVIRNG